MTDLSRLTDALIHAAKKAGAEAADAMAVEGTSVSIDIRAGKLEQAERAEGIAIGLPVLIGGDLNTGNHCPPDFDWRSETLFASAGARGYDWSFTPDGMTTRPSLITPHPTRTMKLDWFAARGLTCTGSALIPALDANGRPLSDHEAIWCRAGIGPRE